MADIPTDQAPTDTRARRRTDPRRLVRLLPGLLAALLFLVLVAGDLLLGAGARPTQAALAILLAGALAAQPPALRALRRLVAWPEIRHAVVVAAILVLALFLRVWGLRFGLPYLEHPDEWAVADRAIEMLRTADYNPHSFIYPTLYTYLQLGVAALHFLWGVNAGLYQTLADIDPARFYLWARALTALLGTGAVLGTYAIGRLLYGRVAGVLAAALLAVYPAATGDAHYITTDTPAMFFSVLAFLVIAWLGLRPPARARDRTALALIAGLCAGLAVATKYNVAVLVLPLSLAILLANRRPTTDDRRPTADGQEPRTENQEPTEDRRSKIEDSIASADHKRSSILYLLSSLSLALLGLLLGFTLGTPMWLRELPQMLNDIASVIVHYKFDGHPGAEADYPALWYWDAFVANGALLAWAFLGGALLACIRHNRADLLILSFAAPTFLQMAGLKVVFFRNAMPLLPFLCLLAAALIVALTNSLRRPTTDDGRPRTDDREPRTENQELETDDRNRFTRSPAHPLTRSPAHRGRWSVVSGQWSVVVALVILAVQPLALSIRDDWLRAQLTTRVLATEWVTQQASDGARIWLEDQTLILPERLRVAGGAPATDHDLDWYRAGGFRYVVVNEDVKHNDPAALARLGTPAARFVPEERHGPTLAIYDTGLRDPAGDPRTPSGATLGAGAIVLDGYQHPAEAQPGTTLPLALYWRATRALPQDYTVYVHLLDAAGGKPAQRDMAPLDGRLPTTRWQPGDLIRDDQDLALPATLAPGTYRLVVGMYDPQTLAAINDAGPIDVGEVIVR